MNRLNIADLSFCDTEINDSEKVKGGMLYDSLELYYGYLANFSFPIAKSDLKLVEQSLAKGGYKTSYYYDEKSGDIAILASKGNGKSFSSNTISYLSNGERSSSFEFAST
ncbi:hypothetical protein [Rivularia sp. UHCC 0363]|uniref:hypothetical protein n=1 Tax=Rivularia sp. UHCC 0363 TaxID=3110244 RepID=UPI002B1EDEFB|nr:hypothetical protein [Rivularia sp. UHCC 0363]MEA5597863.1 hypothetical protein [Rivularia sp. UHCC 0363]